MNTRSVFSKNRIRTKAGRPLFTFILAVLIAFTTIGPVIPVQAASGNMQITPIDFGHDDVWGDCTMLSSGGKNLLMDTYLRDEYDTLLNYLDDHHFYTFDIYLSHYHYDHMHQIPTIINDSRFNVSKVYLPDPGYLKTGAKTSNYCKEFLNGYNAIVNAANDNGVTIVYLKKGSSFTVGNAKLTVLWGCSYTSTTYDASYLNNNSLVTKVTSGDTTFLTCGDIETEVENQLVKSGIDLSADIFKFNHHGGNTSNSAAFLKKVNPSFAFYNWCGDSPSSFGGGWVQTAINNLKNTCNIYSTRYNGMLTFTVKAGHISVAGERNMQTVNVQITDSSGKVVNTVTYQFNDALDYHITARMKQTAATVSASDSTTALPTRYAWQPKFVETSGGVKYRNRDGSYSVNKFQKIDGDTYYFDANGYRATGWKKINNKWYYFDSDGIMLLRWKRINGKKYYLDPVDGHMHTGWEWVSEKNAWYYLDPVGGHLVEGWLTYNGKKYYLTPVEFYAKTGWQKIDGKWYYFDLKNADMKTGWLKVDGKTYYLGTNGVMVTGTQLIDGRTYTFSASGALTSQPPTNTTVTETTTGSGTGTTSGTGTSTDTGTTSGTGTSTGTGTGTTGTGTSSETGTETTGTDTSSETGTETTGTDTSSETSTETTGTDTDTTPGAAPGTTTGDTSDTDASIGTGTGTTGTGTGTGTGTSIGTGTGTGTTGTGTGTSTGTTSDSGAASTVKTGWQKIDGKWYYYNNSGVMQTGWQKIGGVWYYLKDNGVMTTGWQKIKNVWYYFNGSGAMVTGWQKIDGIWYYFNGSGAMLTGSQKIGNSWYYFKDSGVMVTGWQKIDGKWYYYDASGSKLFRWKRINGKKYLLDPEDGHMHTGWEWVSENDAWYYLDPVGGYLVEGWLTCKGEKYYLQPVDFYAVTGWQNINGKRYYFDPSNANMYTGWHTIGSKKYYFGEDGAAATGTRTIDGTTYTFDANGVLVENVSSGSRYDASWDSSIYLTSSTTSSWDNATDSDMSFDPYTTRNEAFVNTMLAYATYFVDKIDYASSVTGDDPNNLRYKRLRSGGKTDCSWFVYHVLYKFGLVGDTFIHSYEWGNNPETYPGAVNIGTNVSNASPGDILCTGKGTPGASHVMIYLGDGLVVECAAGYGVIISDAPDTARQIVHFNCLPKNTDADYNESSMGTWVKSGNSYMFKVGDSYLTNCFQNIDGSIYYFGVDGKCVTGWQTIGGKKYCFASGGQMYLRWKRIDGKKYYFDPISGYMHTGWEWVSEQGAWYYLDPASGSLVTGWQTIGGKTYYFDSDFKMVTGTLTIDGKTYTFASSGALQ